MTNSDLIAMLYEAMHELEVLGSYTYDPDTKWPNVGLKVTSASHAKLAKRIKALLDTEPVEDVSLREENRALRSALAVWRNDEDWRAKYLLEQLKAGKLRAALEATRDSCDPECYGCGAYTVADKALREIEK